MSSLSVFKFGIIGGIVAVLLLGGIFPVTMSASGKNDFSLGASLSNLGNDLANSIIGMVKQKASEGCNGISGSTSIMSSQGSSSSSSSSMMTSSSSAGGGQTIVSSGSGQGRVTICGGPGDDILNGGSGDDIIYGGKGNDKLFGNGGDDILIGGPGADHFDCGPGNDTIRDFNPSEGDTKTNDCENVTYVHNNEQASSSNSHYSSNAAPLARSAPGASEKEKLANNATIPQASIIKSRNPIVPASSSGKLERGTSSILVSKSGSTKSFALLPLNKSKFTNKISNTTSAVGKNTTSVSNINSSHLNDTSSHKTTLTRAITPKIDLKQSYSGPIVIRSGETDPVPQFSPALLNVKIGQQIMWLNPSRVPDPHTVTFVLDKKSAVSLIVPLLVSNYTQFKTVTPGENSMPILMSEPGKTTTLLTLNSRAIEPVVIDHNGLASKITQKNSTGSYNILGSEKYINSGWLLPKGQEKGYPGALTSFEVTFSKPGVYEYADIFHPWMKGKVIVS